MRFVLDGPDIPNDLIKEWREDAKSGYRVDTAKMRTAFGLASLIEVVYFSGKRAAWGNRLLSSAANRRALPDAIFEISDNRSSYHIPPWGTLGSPNAYGRE